jgi:Winged helix DNA-binding domain
LARTVNASIADQRLHNQRITRPSQGNPAKLVAWLGAVQAQEYEPAKWALGLRLPPAWTDERITRSIDRGEILRTHVLRPTWHFVAREDIRWMLELTAPQVHRRMSSYDRQLGLDASVMTRATGIIERALGDGGCLTRLELGAELRRSGLPGSSTHLAHIVMHAELEGVICSGPRRAKRVTYMLLADRAPDARSLPREEALAELARRFFQSHGPATIRDFVWWSGLRTADAKRGVEIIGAKSHEVDGLRYWSTGRVSAGRALRKTGVLLLPVYDEYLVAYRDRLVVPHSLYSWSEGVGIRHSLVIGGQLGGTWRAVPGSGKTILEVKPVQRLTPSERRALAEAAARYQRFRGTPVSL